MVSWICEISMNLIFDIIDLDSYFSINSLKSREFDFGNKNVVTPPRIPPKI